MSILALVFSLLGTLLLLRGRRKSTSPLVLPCGALSLLAGLILLIVSLLGDSREAPKDVVLYAAMEQSRWSLPLTKLAASCGGGKILVLAPSEAEDAAGEVAALQAAAPAGLSLSLLRLAPHAALSPVDLIQARHSGAKGLVVLTALPDELPELFPDETPLQILVMHGEERLLPFIRRGALFAQVCARADVQAPDQLKPTAPAADLFNARFFFQDRNFHPPH